MKCTKMPFIWSAFEEMRTLPFDLSGHEHVPDQTCNHDLINGIDACNTERCRL